MSEKKVYISANSLLLDSYRLAKKIWKDGYRPNFLVAIWRGGTPVGTAIHEYFRFMGHEPYHTAIKTQSYVGRKQTGKIEVKGLDHVIDIVNAEDKLLLVDDVFDTGLTIQDVLRIIRANARKNCPEIRVATVYFKPAKNRTKIKPDYYLKENNNWLVFPHELATLTPEEIRKKGKDVYKVIFGERR